MTLHVLYLLSLTGNNHTCHKTKWNMTVRSGNCGQLALDVTRKRDALL